MNNELIADYADKKIRFYNFLLDMIFFWVLYILHVFLFEHYIKLILGTHSKLNNFIYLITFYFLYYFISEFIFGRTFGKFLTGTKVIDYEDKKPNFTALLIRNLCRLIPFDGFSYLISENGWHDSISKTYVIKT